MALANFKPSMNNSAQPEMPSYPSSPTVRTRRANNMWTTIRNGFSWPNMQNRVKVTDPENAAERDIRTFFETDLGLSVHRIPTSAARTPDFLVDGDPPGYILEVKGRFDDKESRARFNSGGIVSGSESIGWAPWTADTLRNARHQFASFDPQHQRIWIPCFVVRRSFAVEAVFDQVIGTLYGVRQVAYPSETGGATEGRNCLYVVPGAFERWPEIDGAIVSSGNAITLCVNEFSDRVSVVEDSGLCRFFAKLGGPISPHRLESTQGFWSVDYRTIDRSDERAVGLHLAEKYRVSRVFVLDIKSHYASSIVTDASL